MQKFNDLLDRSLVPIATRLNNQRHVAAIRDAFMLIFPVDDFFFISYFGQQYLIFQR